MELLILFSGSSIFKSTGLCGCTSLWLLLDMFMWGQGREGRNVIKKKNVDHKIPEEPCSRLSHKHRTLKPYFLDNSYSSFKTQLISSLPLDQLLPVTCIQAPCIFALKHRSLHYLPMAIKPYLTVLHLRAETTCPAHPHKPRSSSVPDARQGGTNYLITKGMNYSQGQRVS